MPNLIPEAPVKTSLTIDTAKLVAGIKQFAAAFNTIADAFTTDAVITE